MTKNDLLPPPTVNFAKTEKLPVTSRGVAALLGQDFQLILVFKTAKDLEDLHSLTHV